MSNFLLLVTKLQGKFLSELQCPYLSNRDNTGYLCGEELLVLSADMALIKVTSFLALTSFFVMNHVSESYGFALLRKSFLNLMFRRNTHLVVISIFEFLIANFYKPWLHKVLNTPRPLRSLSFRRCCSFALLQKQNLVQHKLLCSVA